MATKNIVVSTHTPRPITKGSAHFGRYVTRAKEICSELADVVHGIKTFGPGKKGGGEWPNLSDDAVELAEISKRLENIIKACR